MSEMSAVVGETPGSALASIPRSVIIELMTKNFEKLPDIDRKIFTYGSIYLSANGSFAGLISNSLYRRLLNVTQARFASSLPMAVLPFMATIALYDVAVTKPLLEGELDCPTCAVTRGALVGLVGAGIYPVLLALPVNACLAARYNTAPLPEGWNAPRFWMELSRPILRKMGAVFLLQAVFGMYLSSRNFETYTKLLKISFAKEESNGGSFS